MKKILLLLPLILFCEKPLRTQYIATGYIAKFESGKCIALFLISKRYYKNPEKTRETIRDGWLYTGDIGWIDEDGFLYIVDRIKDMIISGGENIASSEVEKVIYELPEVLETAVIGIPHPKWLEVPKAYVVLKDGAELTAEK